MKRILACLIGLAVLMGPVSLLSAEDPPQEQKESKVVLKGEHRVMAAVLKLDEDTQAKLAKIVEEAEAPRQELAAKLKELRAARAEAKANKDEAKLAEIAQQIKDVEEAGVKLREETHARVLALLTPEQKTAWDGFVIRRGLMRRFSKLELTGEQEEQMQTMCEQAAPTFPADGKARKEAYDKLAADIEEKVLTDEQRDKLKERREKKPEDQDAEKPADGAAPAGEEKNE